MAGPSRRSSTRGAKAPVPIALDEPALIAALSSPDASVAADCLRQVSRLGQAGTELSLRHFEAASSPLRGRLCAVVGRAAQAKSEPALVEFLLRALEDTDPKTQRNAAIALGKITDPRIEDALLDAFARAPGTPLERTLAASLGKIGGPRSLTLLRARRASDPETARVFFEASLKLERDQKRTELSEIDAGAQAPSAADILFHCRAGLEQLLASELDARFAARVLGPALVAARLDGPLESVLASRIMTRVGFALTVPPASAETALSDRVAAAVTSEHALQLFRTFTRGVKRYRLEWEGAGHRRGLTYATARAVTERCAELVNDPSSSPWQVRVGQDAERLRIELCPRAAFDTRFAYRESDVPAASHPTIAAALARVAGASDADVVWDPFVGSGLELAERGLLGPYARLIGTDVDPKSLLAAERNLRAAGLTRFELIRADARKVPLPDQLDLIITNPPFGQRTTIDDDMLELYRTVLERAASALSSRGRFVWISPVFERTVRMARDVGLKSCFCQRIDMGGFHAEVQMFVRSNAKRSALGRRGR